MPVVRTRTVRKGGVTVRVTTKTPTEAEIRRKIEEAIRKAR